MERFENGVNMVERHEDMSRLGRLRLMQQVDGDLIVAVVPDPNAPSWDRNSVEFCTPGSGGGRSSHTRGALLQLMKAMDMDNQETPLARDEEHALDLELIARMARELFATILPESVFWEVRVSVEHQAVTVDVDDYVDVVFGNEYLDEHNAARALVLAAVKARLDQQLRAFAEKELGTPDSDSS